MTAFECDEPADFMHLMLRLRDSEASRYTERDTPIFVGQHMPLREALARLDGHRLSSNTTVSLSPRRARARASCARYRRCSTRTRRRHFARRAPERPAGPSRRRAAARGNPRGSRRVPTNGPTGTFSKRSSASSANSTSIGSQSEVRTPWLNARTCRSSSSRPVTDRSSARATS